MNLPQREVWVLALDLIGIKDDARNKYRGDLKDFRLRPNQPSFTVGTVLDVGIDQPESTSF